MKKNILFYFFFLSVLASEGQSIADVLVTDISNGKPVSEAGVYFRIAEKYFITDSAGKIQTILETIETPEVFHINYNVSETEYKIISDEQMHVEFLISLIPKNTIFNEVVITGTRAGYQTPLTTTNISNEQLNENNYGEDFPQLLEFTPSVVVTSDAGNGVGYTGLRIRGSDATRVNVTINGVPYNDAESQQTYWVDINDIAESADDVQIQRGVGSSANGMSSFGGSVNIYTNVLDENPASKIAVGLGSFQLLKTSAGFSTGRLKNNWFMQGRVSKINADGYIDRSFAALSSFALLGAFESDNRNYKSVFNIFSAKEKTYQSWAGVPEDSLITNRTYNPYTYENQTDNYTQTHFQWHNTLYFQNNSDLTLTMNYTKGGGYYEQLEEDQYYSDYGVSNLVFNDDTLYSSDIITQKWLDSDFYGVYLQYKNNWQSKLELLCGGALYQHAGEHFGNVIWAEYAQPFGLHYEWYRNDAVKNDANIFSIINYRLNKKLQAYIDVQMRSIHYAFQGFDEFGELTDQQVNSIFFNPKLGLSYTANNTNLFYVSIAKSSHEPNRDDYVESTPLSRPLPETMYDAEAGYKLNWKGWQLYSTVYYMYYENQLVLTGKINDVGAYTRENVPASYRTGIEAAWAKTFFEKLLWEGNFTLSANKIKSYTEYIDNWDTWEQNSIFYKNTVISFSPSVVAANKLEQVLLKVNSKSSYNTSISAGVQSKFVGKQYIDNTSNEFRVLDPYFLNDIILKLQMHTQKIENMQFAFILQNIFNVHYESNAWVYRYYYEGIEHELNGYYPQAGRTFAVSLRVTI